MKEESKLLRSGVVPSIRFSHHQPPFHLAVFPALMQEMRKNGIKEAVLDNIEAFAAETGDLLTTDESMMNSMRALLVNQDLGNIR